MLGRLSDTENWVDYDEQKIIKKFAPVFNGTLHSYASLSERALEHASQEAYAHDISVFSRPFLKHSLVLLFGNDISNIILEYTEWFDLQLKTEETILQEVE